MESDVYEQLIEPAYNISALDEKLDLIHLKSIHSLQLKVHSAYSC